jgi:hypothetical protein
LKDINELNLLMILIKEYIFLLVIKLISCSSFYTVMTSSILQMLMIKQGVRLVDKKSISQALRDACMKRLLDALGQAKLRLGNLP